MSNIFADIKKADVNSKTAKKKARNYGLIAFFAPLVIMALVLFCADAIPFNLPLISGVNTSLRMDLYHQYCPLFAELKERVLNGDSLIYSWTTGLGSNFLGNFFNYLCSPMGIFVFLLSHSNLTDAITLMMVFNAAFASLFFYHYLRKSSGKTSMVTAAFGVLYAFSGYYVAYYWNIMWLQAMVLFPLVMLGIEQIIKSRKIILYSVSLGLIMITNYYMAYMVCIFSVLYFLISYFSKYDFSTMLVKKDNANESEYNISYSLPDKLRYSNFLRCGFSFAAGSLLAAGLAAFALLPLYYILKACSATSGSFSGDYDSYFSIFDFLSNHLASVEPTIRSSGENVMPNVYCGIATLILCPLYLFSKSITKREKIANSVLLVILYFSFNINYLNYFWHGFHFPNDLPYRFSFMYVFVLLVIAHKTVIRLNEFSAKELLVAGAGVVMFVVLAQKLTAPNVSDQSVIISIIFAVIYTIVFISVRSRRYQASSMALILLCCFVSEIAIANTDKYSMSQPKSNYSSDYEAFRTLKDELDDYDASDGKYRMELTYLRTRMDNAWYYYNGVSTFSSMAYERLSNLMDYLGMYSNHINSYTYYPQTAVFNSMMSLRYIVKNSSDFVANPYLYNDTELKEDNFHAYEYKYSLPIAYCVNKDIVDWDYERYDDPFEVQSDYFEKATGFSDVFDQLYVTADSFEYDNIDEFDYGFETGNYTYYKTNYGQEGTITLTIVPEKTQNCYLYIVGDLNDANEINISTDKKSFNYNGEDEYVLDLGLCNAGTEITVEIPIDDDKDSGNLTIYPVALNEEVFVQGLERLRNGQLNVDTFDDTCVSGTFTAAVDCVLYTSIPYDEGWTVKIDGEEAEYYDIPETTDENGNVKAADISGVMEDEKAIEVFPLGNSLLAVKIPAGTHTVEFKYHARGLAVGICVSLLSLIILAALFFMTRISKRKNGVSVSVEDETDDIPNEWDDIEPIKATHTYADLIDQPSHTDNSRIEKEFIVTHDEIEEKSDGFIRITPDSLLNYEPPEANDDESETELPEDDISQVSDTDSNESEKSEEYDLPLDDNSEIEEFGDEDEDDDFDDYYEE